ncbi:MAG: S8/S53 family peptidase [bacterium]|nr:S8/S53 family peptidase [bacterium]
MKQETYPDEAGMIASRLRDLKKLGGRAEYAFKPGTELPGRPPIFYLPRELVTTAEFAHVVHRLLEEWQGDCGNPSPLVEGDNNVVVFPVRGDSLQLAAAIKEAAQRLDPDSPEVVVGPHHVLTPAPQPRIGPGDDPVPASQGSRMSAGPSIETDIPVAVVDTGLWQKPPPQLNAVLNSPSDEEAVDVNPIDGMVDFYGTGHGGFIAGVLEHNAPGTKVIAHNAFGPHGLTEKTVIEQVDAALANSKVIVINLSLGSYEKDDGGCHRVQLVALRAAMRRWRDEHPGALIVAAAGNDSKPYPFFPAGFAGEAEFADLVVSVGALSQPRKEVGIHSAAAGFSNHGSWVTAWAPGERVVSEYPDEMKFGYVDAAGNKTPSAPFSDGLAAWSGTSFAAPFVAAEIIREMQRGETPRATWKRIRGASPFVVFWPGW